MGYTVGVGGGGKIGNFGGGGGEGGGCSIHLQIHTELH